MERLKSTLGILMWFVVSTVIAYHIGILDPMLGTPAIIRKAVSSTPPLALLVNGNGDAPNCRAVTAAVLL